MEQISISAADHSVTPEETRRLAESFVEVYQVTLIQIEQKLGDVMEDAGPAYADGYKPWHDALRDLLNGTYLIAKENQPMDVASYQEALRLFSFDSSVRFLGDLCHIAGIRTEGGWNEKLRAHIEVMMSSMEVTPYTAPPSSV